MLPGAGCGTSSVLPGAVVESTPSVVALGQSGEAIQPLLEENTEIEAREAEADPTYSKDSDDEAEDNEAIRRLPKKVVSSSNCGICRAGCSASNQRDSNASRTFGRRLEQLIAFVVQSLCFFGYCCVVFFPCFDGIFVIRIVCLFKVVRIIFLFFLVAVF